MLACLLDKRGWGADGSAAEMAGGKVASGLIYQIAVIPFIVLTLTGVISWAWLWVLSPLWIEGILVALGAAFGLLISRLRLGNPRLGDGFDGVLRGLGEGPVLDLAYELEDGG